MDDSTQYLNSIHSQVDTNIDEVLDHLDSEFRNWEITINTTFEDTMEKSKLEKTLKLSNFVLNVLENFFSSNKSQIVNQLNLITNDVQQIKKSATKIELDAKNLAKIPTCQNVPKCSNTATNLINHLGELNKSIETYDVISETVNTLEGISDDSKIPELKRWTSTNAKKKIYELLNSDVANKIQDYRNKPREAGTLIKENITLAFNWTTTFNETIQSGLESLSKFTSEYATLIYLTFLSVSIIIALVLLLSTLGLIFGKNTLTF